MTTRDMNRSSAEEEVTHYDDPDDPLVWLRDAIGHAEDDFEQGILNRAHNKILNHRKRSLQHWICPGCQTVVRGHEKPDFCPECGEWGRELAFVRVEDVQ